MKKIQFISFNIIFLLLILSSCTKTTEPKLNEKGNFKINQDTTLVFKGLISIEKEILKQENKDLFTIAKNKESYTLAFIYKNKIYNYQFSTFLNNVSCKVKEINNFRILKKGDNSYTIIIYNEGDGKDCSQCYPYIWSCCSYSKDPCFHWITCPLVDCTGGACYYDCTCPPLDPND